jgi:uncharacterized protein YndB with AHSA1/START domain
LTAPIRISFELACPAEHAFATWTERIGSWWPSDHTVSGANDVTVVLESRVGGRIFERTRDGVEHDWGSVIAWSPPTRLSYSWHLGRESDDATQVEVRFLAITDEVTRVEIEHAGWERLGESAPR